MNIVGILEDSFAYAKDAIWGKWIKWLLLIVFCIIFPLFLGYVAEILRGRKPAPELENWGKMFIDGLKIFVAVIIYAIPVIVVAFISGISTFLILNPFTAFAAFTGFIAVIIVAIIVGIFATIGIIRLARTGKVEEAFNFSEINQRINSIGWANYILALIILQVVLLIIQTIIAHIPAIGEVTKQFLA